MKRVKVAHIHHDCKFILNTSLFEGPNFENKILFIGSRKVPLERYKKNIYRYEKNRKNLKIIIKICSDVNIVILYGLDFFKARIAISLPNNVCIIWRFFGFEVYNMYYLMSHSKLTKKIGHFAFLLPVKKLIKRMQRLLYQDSEFIKAQKRINLFLGVSSLEYQAIRNDWPYLPQFIQFPHYWFNRGLIHNLEQKHNTILIGNSKQPANNHFDIFEIIESAKSKEEILYVLPFSYGKDGTRYSKSVRNYVKNKSEYKLLDRFVPREQYIKNFVKAAAAVYNVYCPIMMGNIIMALGNGVKVYLNKRNIILQALRQDGFLVFTIEDFKNDLENGTFKLSPGEALYNQKVFSKLADNNPKKRLQDDILIYFNKKFSRLTS